MAHGTSISIFLPDGNPDGVRLVSKSHWTGLAVAAPRSRYAQVRVDRDELRRPGVYVLLGSAEGTEHESRVYVGEAVEARERLDRHHAEKDFWTRMVVFTSSGQQILNKATLRHVEAQLIKRAASAGRAELDNSVMPALLPLSEPEVADAEAFLADMLVIFPILGVSVFEPLEQAAGPDRLHLEGPCAKGEGAETEDGFVVYAGALARAAAVESIPSWGENQRRSLIAAGALAPTADGQSLRLTADQVFRSPSAAAVMLLGRSAAGPLEWKDTSGRSLRETRERVVSEDDVAPV